MAEIHEDVPETFTVISHINLHKRAIANADCRDFINRNLSETTAVLIGIQEPHINRKGVTYLPDKSLIYDRSNKDGKARAAIYTSSNLNVTPVPSYTSKDMAAGLWTTGESSIPKIMVVSLYLDGTKQRTIPKKLQEIVEFCRRKQLEILILADMNAHSCMWGETHTNRRGEDVEDFLFEHDLVTLNEGNVERSYTYYRSNSKSIVDVTVTSSGLAQQILDWEVTNEITTSDHRLIKFHLLCPQQK